MKRKGSKSKKTEKKGRERARNKFGTGNGKKRSKFWLVRMHQIKIFLIFVPYLGKTYQFGHKIAFLVKLRLI